MDDDVLVRVENVSKRFCRSLKKSLWYGLQDLGSELGGRLHGGGSGLPQSSADVELRNDEFWAVKDVSFELRRGECLGLIGRNGAGKTTLLRMLNGLIKPDTGRIEMRGRICALIALGAGFNPLLTGRENVYINAQILGCSSVRANEKMDEVLSFSEIGEFIDAPVQSYSSGMQVRLGFAVAACLLDPDILILDEVLAVGDMRFQAKCWNMLGELRKKGCSFIIVSHQQANIERLASNCLLLDKGRQILKTLDKHESLAAYNAILPNRYSSDISNHVSRSDQSIPRAALGRKIKIIEVEVFARGNKHLKKIIPGQPAVISIVLDCAERLPLPVIEVFIYDSLGAELRVSNKEEGAVGFLDGRMARLIALSSFPFCNNSVNVSITIWNSDMTELYDWSLETEMECLTIPCSTGNIYTQIGWPG